MKSVSTGSSHERDGGDGDENPNPVPQREPAGRLYPAVQPPGGGASLDGVKREQTQQRRHERHRDDVVGAERERGGRAELREHGHVAQDQAAEADDRGRGGNRYRQ